MTINNNILYSYSSRYYPLYNWKPVFGDKITWISYRERFRAPTGVKAGGRKEKKQTKPPTIHMIEQYSGNYSNIYLVYMYICIFLILLGIRVKKA